MSLAAIRGDIMESWQSRYAEATPTSRALFERAARVLPAGVSYAIRDFAPYPFYVARAAGCRLTDVDGNIFTDYWCGHGALLLGHAPSCVALAVAAQLERGTHYGFSHALEIELAELLTAMVPAAEMVRFTNSGTEANMYAVGLARAHTGRVKIAKIEGGWHGGYDPLRKAVHAPYDHLDAGLDPQALANTIALPFNDLQSAEAALSRRDVACLLVEPMLGAAGLIHPEPGYLAGLKRLCAEHGTVLIFDEVITGFRLAPGGAQELFGVTPDVVVLGKIAGGGFPIGVIGGRRDIFERFDHRRFPETRERAFHGGTFACNPISMAAGIATLRALQGGHIYRHLDQLGERARAGLGRIFSAVGIPAAITGLKSTVAIHFRAEAPRNARDAAQGNKDLARRYHQAMLDERMAFLTPSLPHMFLSAAHTEHDVAALLAATETFAVREAAQAIGSR